MIELPEGRELALYNVDGEFFATENFCPHKGARLAGGILCGHVIECDWHGWQFDVRTGECLTVLEKIETYEVVLKDGAVRIVI
jgi:nitrite reductase/ring-hydroxylating ferredoxin subunit